MATPDPKYWEEFRREFARSGGKGRQASMTPEQRTEHARAMLNERWRKYQTQKAIDLQIQEATTIQRSNGVRVPKPAEQPPIEKPNSDF